MNVQDSRRIIIVRHSYIALTVLVHMVHNIANELSFIKNNNFTTNVQIAHLQEERASLVIDNERLNERINMAENLEDPRYVHA